MWHINETWLDSLNDFSLNHIPVDFKFTDRQISRKMLNKDIIIYEPYHSGHLLQYVQNAIKLFSEKKLHVIFATTQRTRESEEYKIHLQRYEALFEIEILSHKREYWSKLDYSFAFLKLLHKYPTHYFFLPLLDHIYYFLGFLNFLFPFKKFLISGILFRCHAAYAELKQTHRRRIFGWASKLISRRGVFTKIFVIDLFVYNYLQDRTNQKIVLCPDPIDTEYPYHDTLSARNALNLPPNAFITGMVGEINARKGVDILIKSFTEHNHHDEQLLLLAGKQSVDIKTQLESLKNSGDPAFDKIVQIDRYVTQKDFLSYLMAVDLVAVLYKQHIGPASVMVRAALAGKKIVATDFGWLGHMGKTVIPCCLVEDPLNFSFDTITAYYHSTDTPSNDNGKTPLLDIQALSRFYSFENFNEIVWHHIASPVRLK